MCLFNRHDLEDVDFALSFMDGIEGSEGSPDMEAEVPFVSPDGQLFLVATAARIWVVGEAEQVISDDGPALVGEMVVEVLGPFFVEEEPVGQGANSMKSPSASIAAISARKRRSFS